MLRDEWGLGLLTLVELSTHAGIYGMLGVWLDAVGVGLLTFLELSTHARCYWMDGVGMLTFLFGRVGWGGDVNVL